MAEYEISVCYTPTQQRQLKEATSRREVTVHAEDPFSLLLLEAATTNSKCETLQVAMSREKTPPREFLNALAHFLVTHPHMEHLSFRNGRSMSRAASNDSDDYTALIAAMVGSQSLTIISMIDRQRVEFQKAIMEVFQQKSADVCLHMVWSLFMERPIAFREMLPTVERLGLIIVDDMHRLAQETNQPTKKIRIGDRILL